MYEKALNPSPLEEVEEEDDRDIQSDVNLDYSFQEVLGNIGKEDFHTIWDLMISTILESSLYSQILFCRSILDKIEEVYDFRFTNLKMESKDDVLEIYNFLKFIEYNHLNFLISLFYSLKIVPNKILDFKVLFLSLWTDVSKFVDSYPDSKLVNEFLRTYIKDNLVRYLSKISERKKIEVSISILLKGEEDGKSSGKSKISED